LHITDFCFVIKLRQLLGYLLEKDKVWFENSSEQHQGKKDRPQEKKNKGAIIKKGKVTPLSRATKPRKDHAAVNIFATVAKGSLSELRKTLKDNDLNVLNPSSETLLHVAAAHGHPSITEYLLSKGAKPGVRDRKGRTALHRAAEKGHGGAVKVLLQGGASINQAEETPLHIAVLHNKRALVRLLIGAGANINAVTEDFVTPLHIASQRGNATVARLLLYNKAHVNAQDKQSKCPLHLAVEQGDKTMAETLLKARADPNAQDKEKKTPLHAAAMRGYLTQR
uniref:Uncharacterized protein n=1 Tax=Malurus cyaneus samueli TaxID=2593467 RepID=A0A8C5UBM4_9PASS